MLIWRSVGLKVRISWGERKFGKGTGWNTGLKLLVTVRKAL